MARSATLPGPISSPLGRSALATTTSTVAVRFRASIALMRADRNRFAANAAMPPMTTASTSTTVVFPGRAKEGSASFMMSFAQRYGIGEFLVGDAQRIDELPQHAIGVDHAYAQGQGNRCANH